jgi:hypothetical protein
MGGFWLQTVCAPESAFFAFEVGSPKMPKHRELHRDFFSSRFQFVSVELSVAKERHQSG